MGQAVSGTELSSAPMLQPQPSVLSEMQHASVQRRPRRQSSDLDLDRRDVVTEWHGNSFEGAYAETALSGTIVTAEAAAFAMTARDMDEEALANTAATLGKAISDAMLEVFDSLVLSSGWWSDKRGHCQYFDINFGQ
ncbi:hypothetical protein LXM94_23135 [Rhizobium sp. TRM95111]|nr:hypothetical protein [Rhizobium alarense]